MTDMAKIQWQPYARYRANLETLTTIDWMMEVFPYSTAQVALLIMERNPVVQELRSKYEAGLLTDETLEAFVDKTAEAFKTGYSFDYADAWIAVLWIVRDRPGKFPDEFISYLAEKRCAELSVVCRAAKTILRDRLSSGVQAAPVVFPES